MKYVNFLINISLLDEILSIGITTVMISFLITYILYDIWYDTFYLNNGDARAYKLYMRANSYNRLSQ